MKASLNDLIKECGVTQAKLADMIDVNVMTVNRWNKSPEQLTVDNLTKIDKALRLPQGWTYNVVIGNVTREQLISLIASLKTI